MIHFSNNYRPAAGHKAALFNKWDILYIIIIIILEIHGGKSVLALIWWDDPHIQAGLLFSFIIFFLIRSNAFFFPNWNIYMSISRIFSTVMLFIFLTLYEASYICKGEEGKRKSMLFFLGGNFVFAANEKIILLFNQSQIGDGFDLICENSVEIFYHLKLLL